MQIKSILRTSAKQIGKEEARWLLEFVSGLSHANLISHGDEYLPIEQQKKFAALLQRRENGEPLAYLLGKAPFLNRDFIVSNAVLIPRPETELLVQLAKKEILEGQKALPLKIIKVLELGTGSGIIAISLKKECPQIQISAVDLSKEALKIAAENAQLHATKIKFLEGNWFHPVQNQRFDLIVSNPPYIAKNDAHLAQNGLPFEPQMALTDGKEASFGLSCLAEIIKKAPAHVTKGGKILLEHGFDQASKVRELLKNAGFSGIDSWQDEAQIWRVSGGFWRDV